MHLRSEINDGLNQRAVRAAHDIGFDAQDLAALHAVLGPSTKPVIPDIEQVKSLHPRILRNLSRKEYVRQEALNLCLFRYGRFVEGSYRRLGFGHVIWMRTAWSTVESVGVPQDTVETHKGRWAGDQFDFMENADFTETEVGDDGLLVPWKDVSEEVVKELRSIFGAVNRA
ncbi:hypothetical protein EWM64_g5943 [Hericium alpestre]|uniref:Uncharacterized protein n=1 Tax=Hericium alpestre TaxID=135208 RepID=A0A4Y9ZTE5_9AGAM|nr:hypothetical protein EWM64_g5943 [Hericium alpestre]